MGQASLLNPIQRKFLDLVISSPYLVEKYYWTGGTVLAEFYLRHRESYDIDLFSENTEVHLPSTNKFVGITATKLGAQKVTHSRFLGLQNYILFFPDDSQLKVDFNYYPFPRINKGKKWHNKDLSAWLKPSSIGTSTPFS